MLFYVGAFGFLLGIAVASLYKVALFHILFVVVIALGVTVIGFTQKNKVVFGGAALFLVLVALGMGRFYIADVRESVELSGEVTVEGVVVKEPDVRDDRVWIVLDADGVESDIRIAAPHFPQVLYGDFVRVTGDIERPENFETDTGRVFNYVGYLRKDNIEYLMWQPEFESIESRGGNVLMRNIFHVKKVFMGHIGRAISEPHAALANGILLGSKQGLGKHLEDAFRDTGLIHIVVLSGYNVTIVAIFIMWLFSFLPFRVSRIAALVSIVLFALLVGLGATVVRASLMAALAVFAPVIHRQYNIHRALVFAALAMVLVNPYVLIFDPSFQLSFAATVGLIYFGPVLVKGFTFIPEKFEMRDIVVATISTQIFVLPLLLYMVGEISLVALPVNLLVLPVIPLSMLLAFVTGLGGFIWSGLATLFAFPTYIALAYTIELVEVFARIPYATIKTPPFSVWVVVVWYIGFSVFLFWYWKKYEVEPELFSTLQNSSR